MRRQQRPERVFVTFRGIGYEMDLTACRHALVRRQVEGEFHSMQSLANAIGRSRSSASRFFTGRQTSLPVTLAILGKLKLTFDEVFNRCERDDGWGAAMRRPPLPAGAPAVITDSGFAPQQLLGGGSVDAPVAARQAPSFEGAGLDVADDG